MPWQMVSPFMVLLLFQPLWTMAESNCYGTPKKGALSKGKRPPTKGSNFSTYSHAAWMLGRTYAHSKVTQSLVGAYKILETSAPGKVFVYAEIGWKKGGQFKPHKTHQNGTSVDLMVPVLNNSQESVPLPTNALNKWGYSIEFDKTGKTKNYTIDFEALGQLIYALYEASKQNGISIKRVIFAPDLQGMLFSSSQGKFIEENIFIPKKRSWVRHDEHIHVDFSVPCKALKEEI